MTLVICGCACGARLVARVAVCAFAVVVFYDGRRGCLYRFSVGFPLINRPTLFFLIDENDKSFALFQKKKKSATSVSINGLSALLVPQVL
jgi:hypothetical protein